MDLYPFPQDEMTNFEIGMDRIDSATRWKVAEDPVREKWVNVGAGRKLIQHTMPVDLPDWNANEDPLPYDTESVDGILAYHFLEHVENPIEVLKEFQYVLKVGGVANILVPYGTEDCALQDLSHKHRFVEDTWKNLFSNPYYGRDAWLWRFKVNFNMVMGLNRRNLILLTQLEKT